MSMRRITLKSTTRISLNDRFTVLRNEKPMHNAEGDYDGGETTQTRQYVEASRRNQRLAAQMENRPAVKAALKSKNVNVQNRINGQQNVSVKQRLELPGRLRMPDNFRGGNRLRGGFRGAAQSRGGGNLRGFQRGSFSARARGMRNNFQVRGNQNNQSASMRTSFRGQGGQFRNNFNTNQRGGQRGRGTGRGRGGGRARGRVFRRGT